MSIFFCTKPKLAGTTGVQSAEQLSNREYLSYRSYKYRDKDFIPFFPCHVRNAIFVRTVQRTWVHRRGGGVGGLTFSKLAVDEVGASYLLRSLCKI
jgi:hypothetical protein